MANGLADHQPLSPEHPDWDAFAAGFAYICQELAKKIARDGEGATKLIEVNVQGARSDEAARAIAKTAIGSRLVKSAAFGADANWRRIIASIGRAGQPVSTERVHIRIGECVTLRQSSPVPSDDDQAPEYMKGVTVQIYVNLNDGPGSATA